ncbi:MAG: hypothetical protein FWD92_03175 [Methanomassiliicoccaceae archaeon]|nr:hypothetical protein [Methanomassiliicoccaceae archaeon]
MDKYELQPRFSDEKKRKILTLFVIGNAGLAAIGARFSTVIIISSMVIMVGLLLWSDVLRHTKYWSWACTFGYDKIKKVETKRMIPRIQWTIYLASAISAMLLYAHLIGA